MIGDVTMQHPVAGIVGHECDVDCLLRRNENGIRPLSVRDLRTIPTQHAEAVAVQMHRMPPRGVIAERQQITASVLKGEERRHAGLTIASHGHAVDRPARVVAHPHHSTHAHHGAAAHHAALKD